MTQRRRVGASTDNELIRSLASGLVPVSRRQNRGRRYASVAGGMIATLLLVVLLFGIRPDLAQALRGASFWIKWAYAGILAAIAGAALGRLATPGAPLPRAAWLGLPVGALAAIAVAQLAQAPPSQWHALWMGKTALYCPWRIAMLSVPIFAGIGAALRSLAPTRLRLAGATAGLTAGACAAFLYALACDESSALFVLTWYSLGIALATLAGALLGPRLLRW